MQTRTATIDGTPLRWLEQGDGAPVVLVHGIPTSPALWRHVVPRLPDLRVLAFEMTGYGESIPAGRDRDVSVSAQANRLNAWIEHLDIGPVPLVGHDLGGGVVHIAAVRRRDLCSGLMITNGIGYDSWPIPSVKAMARQVTALDVQDTSAVQEEPSTLDVPARIVWGVADQFQKIEYGERFARDLGTTVRRIERGKHFTPEDHCDVVAEEIRSLVAEVATGRGRPRAGGATPR